MLDVIKAYLLRAYIVRRTTSCVPTSGSRECCGGRRPEKCFLPTTVVWQISGKCESGTEKVITLILIFFCGLEISIYNADNKITYHSDAHKIGIARIFYICI